MDGLTILGTGRCLPKEILTNDDLSKIMDTNDEWIRTRTGIGQRYVAREEGCLDLAVNAARGAIEKSGIDKNQIGVIVVATSTADYGFPSCACLVQKELDIDSEVIAFDISAACTGFLYGLEVCRGLLTNSKKPYALLIGAEKLSKILNYKDRSTAILFGDGGGAAILKLSRSLYIHRAWAKGNVEFLNMLGHGNNDAYLTMEGNEVFKFAVKTVKRTIDIVLDEAGLKISDVDYVLCHQANKRIIENVSRKYPSFEDKFYMNIEKYGNTSAASIPIALDEMYEADMLKENMKILLVGFGAGLTWSGSLVTI